MLPLPEHGTLVAPPDWMPGLLAWRSGRRRRAAAQLLLALGPCMVAVALAPRAIAAWRTPRADVLVATCTLALCCAAGWELARRDVRRLRRGSPAVPAFGWWRANALAGTGAALVTTLAGCALLAPLLAAYDPSQIGDIATGGSRPPSSQHWLGTDPFGRDVLARLLYGARVSLAIAALAVSLAIGIGALVGLVAGYRGGRADGVLMRGVDLLTAFPRLFLVLLVVGLLRPSIWLVIAVLGCTGWMGTARLVRAQVLSVREHDYVRAAEALGFSAPRIIVRHVLPNVTAPLIVSATLLFGQTVLAESILSYLGLGVQVPTPSWGSMIEEGRRVPEMWWLSAFPGLAITLTVVGYNLLGDGLRDALDPRLRSR